MTDTPRDRVAPTARRHYRRHASVVERAGDSVGANDVALANALYAVAGRLRAYADSFDPEAAAAPIVAGDHVRVTFTNGVVVRVAGDVVHVGSARYYGGGAFDRADVERIERV